MNLTTVLFVLAVIAACVFALVISVIRFYSGLLRDEGYLMFTLPVRPWQLVLSKLLTALLTLVVTGLVSFVSVGILFGGIRGLLPSIRTSLEQSFGRIINGWGIALLVLLVVVQVAVSVLQIYLSCSIGHLFRRKRILFAVLFYYAINVVLETVAVTSIIVLSNFEPFCRFLVQLSVGMRARHVQPVYRRDACPAGRARDRVLLCHGAHPAPPSESGIRLSTAPYNASGLSLPRPLRGLAMTNPMAATVDDAAL